MLGGFFDVGIENFVVHGKSMKTSSGTYAVSNGTEGFCSRNTVGTRVIKFLHSLVGINQETR